MPRGLAACGSLSATAGSPVESENRTTTGTDGRVACGARVSPAASGDGTNVPEQNVPFAWAGRNPGWTPDRASRASSNWDASVPAVADFASVLVVIRCSLSGIGGIGRAAGCLPG